MAREKEAPSRWKTLCGNMGWHIVTIVLIIVTLFFYALQIALVFLLFSLEKSIIVGYASPAFYFPLFALAAIILGRFPGIWRILALFANIIVSVLNVGAYALLVYLLVSKNSEVDKQNRIPWWACYLIFGICMVLASIGSLIMGIDDCRWFIRYRQQGYKEVQEKKYAKLPTAGDDEDDEL